MAAPVAFYEARRALCGAAGRGWDRAGFRARHGGRYEGLRGSLRSYAGSAPGDDACARQVQ